MARSRCFPCLYASVGLAGQVVVSLNSSQYRAKRKPWGGRALHAVPEDADLRWPSQVVARQGGVSGLRYAADPVYTARMPGVRQGAASQSRTKFVSGARWFRAAGQRLKVGYFQRIRSGGE